jgi:uncharacterized membrane protein YbhN (UPF0104 family)
MSVRRMKSFRPILTVLIVLIAIAPLGFAVAERWIEFEQVMKNLRWEGAAAAQMLFLFVILLMGMVPWMSLRALGITLSSITSVATYFLSQAPKYLPGGFWAIPGRVAIYSTLGIDLSRSIVSVFRETTAIYLGAALVAFLGIFLDVSMEEELRLILGLGVMASALVITITHLPRIWGWIFKLQALSQSPLAAYRDIESKFVNLRWLPNAMLVSVVFWLLLGIPFRWLMQAVIQDEQTYSWLAASSLFATAWCAGFVIIILPAGIGVRESVLAYLLSFRLPQSEALSIAILSRLWWLVAELVWIVVAVVLLSRQISFSTWFQMRSRLQSIEGDKG